MWTRLWRITRVLLCSGSETSPREKNTTYSKPEQTRIPARLLSVELLWSCLETIHTRNWGADVAASRVEHICTYVHIYKFSEGSTFVGEWMKVWLRVCVECNLAQQSQCDDPVCSMLPGSTSSFASGCCTVVFSLQLTAPGFKRHGGGWNHLFYRSRLGCCVQCQSATVVFMSAKNMKPKGKRSLGF